MSVANYNTKIHVKNLRDVMQTGYPASASVKENGVPTKRSDASTPGRPRFYEAMFSGNGTRERMRFDISAILGIRGDNGKVDWKPTSVAAELLEMAKTDLFGFMVALGELGIVGDPGGWKEAKLHDRMNAAEAAAALAKAGDGSRLPILFMLLEEENANCRKEALRMVRWVGEDLSHAEEAAKKEGFLKIWDIAKTGSDPSEKNLAIDCLVYFREFISGDLVSSARQDYVEGGDKASARLLACAAMRIEDLDPLLEPLGEYSKKSLSSILWTALSLGWTLPAFALFADCVLRVVTRSPFPPKEVVLGLVGGWGLLGALLLPFTLRRGLLRGKCQEALDALSSVQDGLLACKVLARVKESLSFPNEPSSNPLWNAVLAAFSLPNTLFLHTSTLRLRATSDVRLCVLKLADAYATKFGSCRIPAIELMGHMADIIRKPFFRLWAKAVELPVVAITFFTATGPYEQLVQRLRSFGIEV